MVLTIAVGTEFNFGLCYRYYGHVEMASFLWMARTTHSRNQFGILLQNTHLKAKSKSILKK